MLIIPCMGYGQTPNETDTIAMDFVIADSTSTNNQQTTQVDVNTLIEEFKAIMSIPKEQRTIEQWDRAIEILFLIYFNADFKELFAQLQAELDEYTKLTNELDKTIENLTQIYESELATYNRLNELYLNLSELYQDYSKPIFKSTVFACAGYTFATGLSVGFGVTIPIGFISLGGYVGYITNFNDIHLFSINFLIGFSF